MNSSPNRATNPAGKSRRKQVNLDLNTARQMLPLVRSIVLDIVDKNRQLAELSPEQELLDEHRRSLAWVSRQRRYSLHDEITRTQQTLAGAVSELDALGLNLVDGNTGRVDFPTRINGRPAAYSWQLGEDTLGYWCYSGEELRRPIPADWLEPAVTHSRP
jgi:hypothetical protein